MANDGQFPIEITGDASSLVAESKSAGGALERIKQQVSQADKECAESVKVVSQEEVKAALASTEGAKEAFTSKQQLKGAVKGLKEEFPALAHVARLALNPIAFVVAGVGVAWAIWSERVKGLTERLSGGLNLPDLSEQKVGQVHAMAKAYEDFAEAVGKAAKAYGSVDAAAKRDGERIDKEAERNKKLMESHKNLALSELEANKAKLKPGEYEKAKSEIEDFYESVGVKDDEATKQKKLARKAQQEDELRKDAKAKLAEAAGIKVGTAEQDAGLNVDWEAQAKDAKEAKKKSQEWVNKILAARSGEMGVMENIGFEYEYARNYGNMPGSEALALEQKNIAVADSIIKGYNAREIAKPGRERSRRRRDELVGEAGREAGEAETIYREMWDKGGELDQFDADTKNSGKVAQNNALARANKAVGDVNNQSKQLTEQLVQAAESGTKVSAVQFKRVEEVNAALKAAVARIQSLENCNKMNPPHT